MKFSTEQGYHVHQFSIYHLNYETLLHISRGSGSVPGHLQNYRDDSIEAFKALIARKKLRKAIAGRSTREVSECWESIANASKILKKLGWYEKVAEVSTQNALKAVRATTSVNLHWFLNGDKEIQVMGNATRSTASLDIIEAKGASYLYITGGFYSLEANSLVGSYVTG